MLAAPESQEAWSTWVHTLLGALRHAHARGWTHLDVTPDNTLVHRRPDGTRALWLADWGNAIDLAQIARCAASTSLATGTPGFAAPEVERADVWRWGPWSDVFGVARTARFWLEQAGLDPTPEWAAWLDRAEAPIGERFVNAELARAAAPACSSIGFDGDAAAAQDELRDPIWVGRAPLVRTIVDEILGGEPWVHVHVVEPQLGASAVARAVAARLATSGPRLVLPPLVVDGSAAPLQHALRAALGLDAAERREDATTSRLAAWFPALEAASLERVVRWLAPPRQGAPQLRGAGAASGALHALANAAPAPWIIVVDAATTPTDANAWLRELAATGAAQVVWAGPSAAEGRTHVLERLPSPDVAAILSAWGVPEAARAKLVEAIAGRAAAVEGTILRAGTGGAGDLGMRPLREQYERNVANQLALACAASLGTSFDARAWRSTLDVVGALSGRHLEPVLLELGVWDEPVAGVVAFRHEQVRAVVLEWAGADGLTERAHAACVSVLLPTADDSIEACVRVAFHAGAAGQADLARMLWTRACRAALRAGRLEDALAWAEAALRLEASEERAMALSLVRWKAIRRLWRDAPDAPRSLERLHDAAVEAGMLDLAASADIEHAYWRMALGDVAGGLALAQRGRSVLEAWGEDAQIGVALAAEALLLRRSGDVEGALRSYGAAADRFRDADDPHSLAHCELGRANTLLQAGRVSDAVLAYAAARDGLAGDPAELANVFNGMGECARLQGELPLATDLYTQALALWDLTGSNMRGMAVANLGIVLAQRGSFEAARRRLSEAYRLFCDGGRTQASAQVLLWRAVAAEDVQTAVAHLEEVGVYREGLDPEAEAALRERWGGLLGAGS